MDSVGQLELHSHAHVTVDGPADCATREVHILFSLILKLTNYTKITLTLFRFNNYTNTKPILSTN